MYRHTPSNFIKDSKDLRHEEPRQLGEFDVIHSHVLSQRSKDLQDTIFWYAQKAHSLIKLLGVCLYMGRIYVLLVVKVSMHMLVNPWSFIIHMGMNYVKLA